MTERLTQHERVIEAFLDQIWMEKGLSDNSLQRTAWTSKPLPSGWLRRDRSLH